MLYCCRIAIHCPQTHSQKCTVACSMGTLRRRLITSTTTITYQHHHPIHQSQKPSLNSLAKLLCTFILLPNTEQPIPSLRPSHHPPPQPNPSFTTPSIQSTRMIDTRHTSHLHTSILRTVLPQSYRAIHTVRSNAVYSHEPGS